MLEHLQRVGAERSTAPGGNAAFARQPPAHNVIALRGMRSAIHKKAVANRNTVGEAAMGSAPVRMTVSWRVPQGQARSITSALQTVMIRTRAEPGCTGCSVSTEMGALVAIHYVENWQTESDLQRQIRSDRFATLAELMEQATEHPFVEFALPGKTRGIDYAEDVRRTDTDTGT
jgi:quinol monooxygenase YgiN